ncbi:hypothetical protein B0T19DRAFT_118431 [Cercophora scortea]|uniref:Uncharacterized protein n=1 Tax=Cercophora scortea TaxID=314031 RepID=A0AAE0MHU6_9PEZI|nr:hypothetical protein B0T19DRAFT_118431 [Cercophora scortea]
MEGETIFHCGWLRYHSPRGGSRSLWRKYAKQNAVEWTDRLDKLSQAYQLISTQYVYLIYRSVRLSPPNFPFFLSSRVSCDTQNDTKDPSFTLTIYAMSSFTAASFPLPVFFLNSRQDSRRSIWWSPSTANEPANLSRMTHSGNRCLISESQNGQ